MEKTPVILDCISKVKDNMSIHDYYSVNLYCSNCGKGKMFLIAKGVTVREATKGFQSICDGMDGCKCKFF